MQEQLKSEVWQTKAGAVEAAEEKSISAGDTVWLREADLQATVLSVSEETRQVEVQAGRTKLTLSLYSVERVAPSPTATTPAPAPVRRELSGRRVSMELDLRGKRADEIEWALDSYLNDASLANLSGVRIIHGIGTGTVRKIVRDFLASHPLVKSFRPGKQGEGGDGATVVTL